MSRLLDKLRDLHAQPADADLLGYLGLRPGDPLHWDKDFLTAGDETVAMAAVRAARSGPPIPAAPGPRRSVTIGDL